MKKPQKPKRTRVSNKLLFPRRRARIPGRVQAASELWLDLFIGFCDGLLAARVDEVTTDYPTSKVNANNLTQKARELADSALHEYEDRWPDVKLEGTRD